jgi:sialic acid synthase SpsE/D-lyxose ketol-isomerase
MINSLKKKLFIFEFANNHNGSVNQALKMVDEVKKISSKYSDYLDFAIKLQYRNLKSFIHKKADNKNKYIKRFRDTEILDSGYSKISNYIKRKGFKLIITPFDELSVDKAINDKVDILKIASCSNNDWTLIEKIVSKKKPIICSTGGLGLNEIDSLYNFFTKRIKFSLLHCISVYPINKMSDFNMSFLNKMRKRYKNCEIGYSGHEKEDNFLPIIIAATLGGTIFERHFSIFDTRNEYSIETSNLNKLLEELVKTIQILGTENKKINLKEEQTLDLLRRGVFLKRNKKKGSILNNKDIYLSFPKSSKDQLSSFSRLSSLLALKNLDKEKSLLNKDVSDQSNLIFIRRIVHQYKFFLLESEVVFPNNSNIELSHHHGIKNIEKIGALLLTVINNSMYCKKIIALLPNQFHPQHKHFKKVETFHVLFGKLTLKKENKIFNLDKGDKIDVYAGEWHSFWTDANGVIFEEISTEAINTDSEYFDDKINKMDRIMRKTTVLNW